jgi:Uri superfamily endonuclease
VDQEKAITVIAKDPRDRTVCATLRNGILLPGDGENPLSRHGEPSASSRWFVDVLKQAQLEILMADEQRKIEGLERAQAAKQLALTELRGEADLAEGSQYFR